MLKLKKYNVIGIMSGTSMDGLDCSYLNTDGENSVKIICEKTYKYSTNYKNKLKKIIRYINKNKSLNKTKYIIEREHIITNKFIQIIKKFIKDYKIKYTSLDYIGLSGQTILHDPNNKITIQLGSCRKIQQTLKIKTVGNFRENDIKYGGQGAPIGAFYHKYILKKFSSSAVIINIGGIANICHFDKKILTAFDVGPGNVLIDDLMNFFYKKEYDNFGYLASNGKINKKIIDIYKNDKFFKLSYPKSLDREYFKKYFQKLKKINKNDALHTASIMTVNGIFLGIKLLNKEIKTLILTGGGRKNLFVANSLKKIFKTKKIKIILIDKLNYDGDLLEAQTFGYLAIRCVHKLPLSLPTTTNVKKPISGGKIYK